ncbi:MAG: lipopolysaccharide biosynthesis protein [Sphingomonadales bacterium]|nr:lipopolysaccharide biosynthesis protein [Sphingomonadales bacterium]
MKLPSTRQLMPIAALYSGRVGVAALGLIILPWLSKSMPAAEFGLAATILSLQSLAVVLDLGLAMTASRELPPLDDTHAAQTVVKRSERVLFLLYFGIAGASGTLAAAGFIPVTLPIVLLTCISLLLIVWQNIILVALISRQRFFISTSVQFLSLFLRHCFSLALVTLTSGTLQSFIIGQVIGAAIVLIVSRQIFMRRHKPTNHSPKSVPSHSATNLAMMAYSIAGACAMQLDKVLLSGLASPALTGPYFLASTLSLVPIAFLATPVAQFVQPKLIACIVRDQRDAAQRWILRLTIALIALSVIPGILLGIASPSIVPVWLQGSADQDVVSSYVFLLMPGTSLGALGLVPAMVLIAKRDYRALAAMSCVLTIAVLSTTAFLAAKNDIRGICIAYALYHVLAAIALWWRAGQIDASFPKPFVIGAYVAKRRRQPDAGNECQN